MVTMQMRADSIGADWTFPVKKTEQFDTHHVPYQLKHRSLFHFRKTEGEAVRFSPESEQDQNTPSHVPTKMAQLWRLGLGGTCLLVVLGDPHSEECSVL